MNTQVPSTITLLQTDVYHRQWVSTIFLGVKKPYTFFKSMKGTAFMMFMVYNDHHKSPYSDVVNSRFGVEILLKKKVKPSKSP